jgi:RNA polymerase sigma-70 factor, ECF subfamily
MTRPSHSEIACVDELELVKLAKTGDECAFSQLVKQSSSMLQCVAIQLVGNSEDAADCVQETMASAFVCLRKFDGRSTFGTWTCGILRNVCSNRLRSDGRARHVCLESAQNGSHFVPVSAFSEPMAPPEPDRVAATELAEQINAALEMLSPEIRTTFVLLAESELSYKEIAAFQKIPIGTVMSRIHAARKKLKAYLRMQKVDLG